MGTVLSRGAVLLWLARAQCQCMSKMCNPFYIGLKLPSVNEALWNRMPGVGISTGALVSSLFIKIGIWFRSCHL